MLYKILSKLNTKNRYNEYKVQKVCLRIQMNIATSLELDLYSYGYI